MDAVQFSSSVYYVSVIHGFIFGLANASVWLETSVLDAFICFFLKSFSFCIEFYHVIIETRDIHSIVLLCFVFHLIILLICFQLFNVYYFS